MTHALVPTGGPTLPAILEARPAPPRRRAPSRIRGLRAALHGRAGRPLRFALTGLIAGLTQLGLLALLAPRGVPGLAANALAFLLAAQLNFAMSQAFTWRDRAAGARTPRLLARRWLLFHGSIAGAAALNMFVFAAARLVVPDLLAAALGIAVAAAVNFTLHDRITFRAVEPSRGHRPVRLVPEAPLRVDVVIPVYNEQHALVQSVTTLHRFLREHLAHEWRIVIADNASTDATLAVAQRLAERFDRLRVVHLDQKGRGRALRAAWLGSDADVLAYMDVDLSTDLGAFPALVDAITMDGYDLATGRRLGPGARVERRRLLREITSRGYNLIIKLLYRARFTDAQCGFKAITRRAAAALVPLVENQGWFFDTELLLLAEWSGYRVKQIPVQWVDDPDSRVNVVKTAIEDLRGLWRLRRMHALLRQTRPHVQALTRDGSAISPPARPEPRLDRGG